MLLLSPGKSAADYFYHFTDIFSGTTPPGTSPWIDAFFHDVSPGTVELTVTAPGLASGEFLNEFFLNLNPGFMPTNLVFTKLSTTGTFTDPVITKGVDAFQADGDGKYDVDFSFGTATAARFEAGESIKYQITGIAGLVALDFNYPSAPMGGHGPFLSAVHVAGFGNGDSAWIAPVPEPTTAALFCLAMGILGGGRWLIRRSKKA